MKDASAGSTLLGERTGLSDDIAFLRPHYPRGTWRAHANFGQLAAFWLHVHAGLRDEGREVARIVEAFRDRRIDGDGFAGVFAARLDGFLHHLDQHHRIEDAAYFPKFRQLDARLVAGFDLLEADHALIHGQLVATVGDARRLLDALSTPGGDAHDMAQVYAAQAQALLDLLLRHLADEEDLVIPAMLRHGERPLL